MLGGGLGANQSKILGAGSVSNTQALNMNTSSATFLQSELNINDPAVLRKRIADLEAENKKLKERLNLKMLVLHMMIVKSKRLKTLI